MKVLGLIVEYNPFHNGHLYHLNEAKRLTNADYVVAVMSGNFIQRGEPALLNKWTRAQMSICSGIDLVIELPTVYAMASAEFFAMGAVKILNSLGIVDYLCFGSEAGEIESLNIISSVLVEEPNAFKNYLKDALEQGFSFATSREIALKNYFLQNNTKIDSLSEIISSSNNILGIEYLKALKKQNSSIKAYTINRIGNSYNQTSISGAISSATSIRKLAYTQKPTGNYSDLALQIPQESYNILAEEFKIGRGPIFSTHFDNIIISKIRSLAIEEISKFAYVSEGLENRIKKAANISTNINELIENILSKRFTRTRISRIIFSILLNIYQEDLDKFNSYGGPQYARILGFNRKGIKLLSKIKDNSTIPLITKTSIFKNSCNPLLKKMLNIDFLATDLYVLAYNNNFYKNAGQDFTYKLTLNQ